jgi:hypothetical protein
MLPGLAAGLVVLGVTTAGCGSGDSPAAASSTAPSSSVPSAPVSSSTTSVTTTTKTTTATTTSVRPTPPPCGSVPRDSVNAGELPEGFYARAKAVHRAACANDAHTLGGYLDIEAGSAKLSDFTGSAKEFHLLAKTLETKPYIGQGGMTYCGSGGAVAIFPRGVVADPSTHVTFWDGVRSKPRYAGADCG